MLRAFRSVIFDSPLEGPVRGMRTLGVRLAPALASAEQRRSVTYDRQTVEIARRVLRPDSNSVDAGANAGTVLKALTKFAPHGRHYAFEPIPYLAARLTKRYPAVSVHQVALAEYDGESTFRIVRDSPALSSLFVRDEREAGHEVSEIQVKVRRLDDVIAAETPIAFIKVDVEGAEAALFRGASRILREQRPVVVFESGVTRLPEILDLMRAADLVVSTLDDYLHGTVLAEDDLLRTATAANEFMFVAAPPG